MKIAEHDQTIAMCNRCGFCQVACPTFRATGQEAGVARGRVALLRALNEGRLEWSPDSMALVAWRVEPPERKEVYLIQSPLLAAAARLSEHGRMLCPATSSPSLS